MCAGKLLVVSNKKKKIADGGELTMNDDNGNTSTSSSFRIAEEWDAVPGAQINDVQKQRITQTEGCVPCRDDPYLIRDVSSFLILIL